MDVLKALAICGGAARRPALARLGIDDAALRRAVRPASCNRIADSMRSRRRPRTRSTRVFHHGEWTQVKKDQRRNNGSVVRGYSVLRYYYEDVVHHPELMLAEVQAVLAGASSSGAG